MIWEIPGTTGCKQRDAIMKSMGNRIEQVRRNHALEHATVSILLEGGEYPPLVGYSTSGGFYLFGRAPTNVVRECVQQAVRRLLAGHTELAVSPHCGTNIATGLLVGSLLSALIMRGSRSRLQRLPLLSLAVIGAAILSRPLGSTIQRHITTSADVRELQGWDISCIFGGTGSRFSLHRVGTRFVAGQRELS